jgi:hypothetical protein
LQRLNPEQTITNVLSSTGFFGEGVKVEINCLIRAGMSVRYRTGQTIWSFRHETDGLGEKPVLCLISKIVHYYEPSTTMQIYGPHNGPFVNMDNYLFFQPGYDCFSCPSTSTSSVSGLEILCEARHFGRVYVSGIFVMAAPRLERIGLNYVGHGSSYKQLGLTESRNYVYVWYLIQQIPNLLAHIKSTETEERVGGFVRGLFELLQSAPESDICHLADASCYGDNVKALARDLLEEFQRLKGTNAIPTCRSEASWQFRCSAQFADSRQRDFDTADLERRRI